MTRTIDNANRVIFDRLADYCARRGEPIADPVAFRFISGTSSEAAFYRRTRIGRKLKLGRHKSLAHLIFDQEHYVGLLGFDIDKNLDDLYLIDNNAGISACLFYEMDPSPTVRPAHVINVVDAGSSKDVGYPGHDISTLELLFPRVQVFQSSVILDDENIWQTFLRISAEECKFGGSWIQEALADDFIALASLNISSLPYRELCRSLFDLDPRSLFMALYRCVEATYAFESCRKMIKALSLTSTWIELASTLDKEVGWHPREASSLNLVLKYALERDLRDICNCLGEEIGNEPAVSAGKAIYRLRNQIVHHRIGMTAVDVDGNDWNRICRQMISIVLHVFTSAYDKE